MGSVEFQSKTENPNYPGVIDVSAEEVKQLADQVVLIDVRQQDEFVGELGHISGSKLIVLDELMARLDEVPRDKEVVFICRSGNRSGKACAIAAMDGIESVYNMAGGMLRWNELGFEIEK